MFNPKNRKKPKYNYSSLPSASRKRHVLSSYLGTPLGAILNSAFWLCMGIFFSSYVERPHFAIEIGRTNSALPTYISTLTITNRPVFFGIPVSVKTANVDRVVLYEVTDGQRSEIAWLWRLGKKDGHPAMFNHDHFIPPTKSLVFSLFIHDKEARVIAPHRMGDPNFHNDAERLAEFVEKHGIREPAEFELEVADKIYGSTYFSLKSVRGPTGEFWIEAERDAYHWMDEAKQWFGQLRNRLSQ
ncbi:MAG: hypothetical protein AAF438_06795 [Pseudomonadota bacterium]